MFFTQDDYKKIQQWLIKNSVKDTEFNEANIPFNGEETITIVQGNQNKKVFLKDLIAQVFNLGISDFVNITDKYDAPNISLEEAIRLIPSRARKTGQVITFLNKDDNWQIYQFKGALNQWNVLDTWKDLFDIEESTIETLLPDEEDLTKSLPDENGNSYLLLKDREYNPEDFSGLGRVILRKSIVEVKDPIYGKVKKNCLYQNMINKENTIYEIRYDFDLNGQEIAIPEGCVLDFQGGNLSNGLIICNNTKLKLCHHCLDVYIKGNCINNYIEQDYFYEIDKFIYFINNVNGVINYNFSKGTYYPTIKINKEVDNTITLNGNSCCLVYNYNNLNNYDSVITLTNKEGISNTKNISSIISKGDRTLNVSDSNLSVGDIIVLHDNRMSSFSPYRNYKQGEFCTIRDIDGDLISIDHPIFGNYADINNCTISKIKFYIFKISNLNIKINNVPEGTELYGLKINKGSGILENVKSEGFTRCISLFNNYNSAVTNCLCSSDVKTYDTVSNYGLRIEHSQNVSIIGGVYNGGNHGIDVAGYNLGKEGIINRNVTIQNTNCSSNKYKKGISTHANAEFIHIINNVSDGIICGGKNNIIESNYTDDVIQLYDLASWENKITNNICGRIYVDITDDEFYGPEKSNDNWTPETGIESLLISNNKVKRIYVGEICNSNFYPNHKNIHIIVDGNTVTQDLTMQPFPSKEGETEYVNSGNITIINNILNIEPSNIYAKNISIKNNKIITNFVSTIWGVNINICNNEFTSTENNRSIFKLNGQITPSYLNVKGNIFNHAGGVAITSEPTDEIQVVIADNVQNNCPTKIRIYETLYNEIKNIKGIFINNISSGYGAIYANGHTNIVQKGNITTPGYGKDTVIYDTAPLYFNDLDTNN